MNNRLGSVNDDVLKTIYEARENGTKVSKALRSVKATAEEIGMALKFLEQEGYIEKNNYRYVATDEEGNDLHVLDAASVITDKGYNYLEKNKLI